MIKHILETKSKYGSFSKTHKLHNLLAELCENTEFSTDTNKYYMALQTITV